MFQFFVFLACDVFPLGIWKVLLELSLVMMKGSPCSIALDAAPVKLIADGVVTFSTAILTSDSVRWYLSF